MSRQITKKIIRIEYRGDISKTTLELFEGLRKLKQSGQGLVIQGFGNRDELRELEYTFMISGAPKRIRYSVGITKDEEKRTYEIKRL